MNPDYHIEQFWLGFKQSMENFYHNSSKFSRNIKKWSEYLNQLQSLQKYNEIEKNIRNYISLYAIDLMKTKDKYNAHILSTNIKRWNTISLHFGFNIDKGYYNKIFMLFDIYYRNIYMSDNKNFISELVSLYEDVELFIIHDEFSSLIDLSIKYEKSGIIDKLAQLTNVVEYVNKKYNLQLSKGVSAVKIIWSLKN